MVYYLGSKSTLGHGANTRLLDGDPHQITLADRTPDDGLNPDEKGFYAASQGRPIRTEYVPTKIEWQEDAPVPDVETQHGMVVVPERFREIVEQFEPGVHQFLPVAYVDRAGKPVAQRYYFVPCNRLDSVDRQASTMILWKGSLWLPASDFIRRNRLAEIPPGFDVDAKPQIVFNNAQIGDKHAWCDKFLMSGIEISDGLAEALSREGFSGLSLQSAAAV